VKSKLSIAKWVREW